MKSIWLLELEDGELPSTDELTKIAVAYDVVLPKYLPVGVRIVGDDDTAISTVRQHLIALGVPVLCSLRARG